MCAVTARASTGPFYSQDRIQRASRDVALHIAKTGPLKQLAVFMQTTFLALGADQHIQGLQLSGGGASLIVS